MSSSSAGSNVGSFGQSSYMTGAASSNGSGSTPNSGQLPFGSATGNAYNGFNFKPFGSSHHHHLPHPHHHQLSYIEEYHHYQQQRNKYDDISLFRNNFVNIF